MDAIRIVVKGGSYMSPSIAREIVTHLMGGRVSKATILTERQKEILEKLVEGKSYGAIAQSLFISIAVSYTHLDVYKRQVSSQAKVHLIDPVPVPGEWRGLASVFEVPPPHNAVLGPR